MDIYTASDGGIVQIPHTLSVYDSLDAVYSDIAAATGMVIGNALIFTDDGKELKQDVLEELWDRGGHGAAQSSPRRQVLYLFNRETFFSDPERWADELKEDVVLPPPLTISSSLDLSHAQAPFAVAYDHLCHLQSLFKAQAHALRIAYANLTFHLQPIVDAFREFAARADAQLDHQEKLLQGYDVDMSMLPKVVVHESLFRRRDKDVDDSKRKTLVDWIHTKKMEQVREWCQSAHTDYVNRYNSVVSEIDGLALESDAERQDAERRILNVEQEFDDALGRIELAGQQIEALMQSDSDIEHTLLELDQAMREDLASMTTIKNTFTLDLHQHLRHIADFQVRIAKFSRPMTDLDLDLRQKNAFPHLERLHNLPFAYAANVIEVVHRKDYSTALIDWAGQATKVVNILLAAEAKRRQLHKVENQLPWEVPMLEGSQTPRIDVTIGGSDTLASAGLGRSDVDDLLKWVEQLKSDPSVANLEDEDNPIPALSDQVNNLISRLDTINGELASALSRAVATIADSDAEFLRARNAELEKQIAEMERVHDLHVRDMEAKHDGQAVSLRTREGELQEEISALRTELREEMVIRQQLTSEVDDKARELEDRTREWEDQRDLLSSLQANLTQEKDRATDIGVRLQEALLDVDGLRSAEHSLIIQIRELQEERTRTMTDLGEAQLAAQNYESELAGVRAELESTTTQLAQAQLDRDAALKEMSTQAEKLMRDHIAEADGDRAVLEHQNLTLTNELEVAKTQMSEQLTAAKNAAIRREDGLKAELSFTKAQLREVQRRETVIADELALAKDASMTLSKKETHQAEMAKDAVSLATTYHEACQRLMGAITASTTISSSLQLPMRAKSPPRTRVDSPANSSDMRESTVLVRSLETASSFDLDTFTDSVLRTINLARKLSKSCKQYRDQARNKITVSTFGKGDLVLFLPTRNAAVKAWAAFNIAAPHHFLQVTDSLQHQLANKDYYLARIVNTEEAVVNGDVPETNPYGLAEGLRYFSHTVEDWTPTPPRPTRRSISAPAPSGMESVPLSPVAIRARETNYFQPTIKAGSPSPHAPSPKGNASSPNKPSPPLLRATQETRAGSEPSQSPLPAPIPSGVQVGRVASVSPRSTSPANPTRPGLVPLQPGKAQDSAITHGSSASETRPSQDMTLTSPPPPQSSPISPITPSVFRAGSIPSSAATAASNKRSHRTSLASTASPPTREGVFGPSSFGRPSSVASSSSSHPLGLPIPAGSGKGVPAAAVTTSAEGSPHTPSSFGDATAPRRVVKKSSVASIKAEEIFRPSPLGSNEPFAGNSNGRGQDTGPGAAQGDTGKGFLSGLSLSRKRQSSTSTTSALDMLKRLEGGGSGSGGGGGSGGPASGSGGTAAK